MRTRIMHEDDYDDEGNEVTHSLGGGSSMDIEKSIYSDTYINTRIIAQTVRAVSTLKGDLGAGTLQEMTIDFDNGTRLKITGVGMKVEVTE